MKYVRRTSHRPITQAIRRASGSKLDVGSHLLKNAFDSRGRLLLAAGGKIEDIDELSRLTGPDVAFRPIRAHATSISALAAVAKANLDEPPSMEECSQFNQRVRRAMAIKADAVRGLSVTFSRIMSGRRIEPVAVRNMLIPLLIELLQDAPPMLSLTLTKESKNYIANHSVNVCILATALTLRSGLTKFVEDVAIGSLLHDIGKAGIPKEIMNKTGQLTEAEAKIMKQHPRVGGALLSSSSDFSDVVVSCITDHHENMMGTGYPRGLTSESISLFGMITAIANVYDILTTDRPYRKALRSREALAVMVQQMSNVLEPNLLKAFISLIGYYPVGTKLDLANGYKATVVYNNPSDPTRPGLVQLISDPSGLSVPGQPVLDLRTKQQVTIMPQPKQAPPPEVMKVAVHEIIHGFHAFA